MYTVLSGEIKTIRFLNTIEDPCNTNTVRRKMPDGSSITVQCPIVAKLYNKYMGGIWQIRNAGFIPIHTISKRNGTCICFGF